MMQPSTASAAVAAAAAFALWAGHMIGDHPVQSNAAATNKGIPSPARLAAGTHPWTGWRACLSHVATYLICQAVALAIITVVAPLTWTGAAAALTVSGVTHAVIDRRWIVQHILRAKGGNEHWPEGPYQCDQALHTFAILLAAVAAASITSITALLTLVAGCTPLIAGALLAEQRLGAAARATSVDPSRL